MNKEKFVAAIIEEINDMDSDGLINLNNRYCEEVNYYDDMIYENGQDFFETHFSNDIMEAVRAASYGEYDYTDNYVKFNGYGNLESLDYITTDDLGNSVDEIAKEVAENFSTYTDIFSISEDEFEDEEEEEEDEEEEETEEIN